MGLGVFLKFFWLGLIVGLLRLDMKQRPRARTRLDDAAAAQAYGGLQRGRTLRHL